MDRSFSINGRAIGPDEPPYVVAEMSANHNGSFDRAQQIIEAAHEAGADAIKLQTQTPEGLTIDCDSEYFQVGDNEEPDRTLYDLYHEAHTPWEWHEELKELASELGMDLFSSPFSTEAVDFLESLNLPAYKIASFENVDLPLIRRISETGKPIIMSTGMATLAELDEAVRTAHRAGADQVALLKCTSSYPAPADEMNLRTIPHLSKTFDATVGLSDHTTDLAVPVTAVTFGASIVEKHIRIGEKCLESDFALMPDEFARMVEAVHTSHRAAGSIKYGETDQEAASLRRSLFAVESIEEGEAFSEENIRSIRPGHGLHPRHLDDFLGQRAACNIERGTPLSWDLLGGAV